MFRKIIFIFFVFLFSQASFICAENSKPNNVYLPYTWDCTYYFRTNGAPNSCGAEAWMTLTGDKDTIYAAKGTKEQFIKMEFEVEDALRINEQLPYGQRLKIGDKFIMVEYTKHKIQSLVGYTHEKVFASILLLPGNNFLVKFEGPIEDLKKLKSDIIMTGNTDEEKKIQLLGNLQLKKWGVIENRNTGKMNIVMHKKGQKNSSAVSLEDFIGHGI